MNKMKDEISTITSLWFVATSAKMTIGFIAALLLIGAVIYIPWKIIFL